jgi:pentatricopeptide repeat protein
MGRGGDALEVAGRAEAAVTDAELRAEVAAARAGVLLEAGQVQAAFDLVEPSLRLAAVPAGVGRVASACLVRLGRPVEALAVGIRGQAAATASGGVAGTRPEAHWANRSLALVQSGRIDSAHELLVREHERAVSQGNGAAQAELGAALAHVELLRGSSGRAVHLYREAVELYGERRWWHPRRRAATGLVHALGLAGRVDEAKAVIEEMAAAVSSPGPAPAAELLHARAWVAAAEGDLPSARRLMAEGAAAAASAGDVVAELECLLDTARLAYPAQVAGRLAALSQATAAPLVDVAARYARGLAVGDAAALEQASATFERMGHRPGAAEAAAQAATLLYRGQESRRAARAEARAAQLARRGDGVNTPALRRAESQAALSPRQLEIATLAASGVPNREIAERLFLSVRTVETQLQRVYEKLGIDRRAKLKESLAAPA